MPRWPPAVTPAAVAAAARVVDEALRGLPGVLALADHHELLDRRSRPGSTSSTPTPPTSTPPSAAAVLDPDELERASAESIALRDVLWAIRRDRLRTVRAVADLAGRDAGVAALGGYLSIQQALSTIDRMEVRGRDSAGVHVFVWDHDLDVDDPAVARARSPSAAAIRCSRPAPPASPAGPCRSCTRRRPRSASSATTPAVMREAIAADGLLRLALAARGPSSPCSATPAGPASASSPSPTPTPSTATRARAARRRRCRRSSSACSTATSTTTPISGRSTACASPGRSRPTPRSSRPLVARHRQSRQRRPRSRRSAARSSSFEGSVAIGAAAADEPGRLFLALNGSGQGVYVGLADDRYVVASEPYGVVEETEPLRPPRRRARRPGRRCSTPTPPARSTASAASATTAPSSRSPRPTSPSAEVTTRDIDRGDSPHFLLKEITESPDSLAKTLRGKIVEHRRPRCAAFVGARALPAASPRASPPARSPGSASSARARPPSPGSRWPPSSTS